VSGVPTLLTQEPRAAVSVVGRSVGAVSDENLPCQLAETAISRLASTARTPSSAAMSGSSGTVAVSGSTGLLGATGYLMDLDRREAIDVGPGDDVNVLVPFGDRHRLAGTVEQHPGRKKLAPDCHVPRSTSIPERSPVRVWQKSRSPLR